MRGERREIVRMVAACEDAAVELRVQGLDAAVQHFGKTGDVRHVGHGQAGVRAARCAVPPGRTRARSRARRQAAPEIDDSGLVRDAQQGSWHMEAKSSIIFWTPGGPGAERERPQSLRPFLLRQRLPGLVYRRADDAASSK